MVSAQFSERPRLKATQWGAKERQEIKACCGLSTYTCSLTCMHQTAGATTTQSTHTGWGERNGFLLSVR